MQDPHCTNCCPVKIVPVDKGPGNPFIPNPLGMWPGLTLAAAAVLTAWGLFMWILFSLFG